MRFFPLMFLILMINSSIIFAKSDTDKSKEMELRSSPMIPPLLNQDRFAIYYVFDDILSPALKETTIKHLQKLGTVCLSDESKLSKEQKLDRCRPGGMIIDINATQVAEENIATVSKYQNLPVVEVCMKVICGAELPQNGSKSIVTIWEKEQYIVIIKNKEEFVQKAVNAMDNILDTFIQEYQRANPKVDEKKPQFFFYY